MVQAILQHAFYLDTNGAIRFSPIQVLQSASAASMKSNRASGTHIMSSDAPMAAPRSTSPSATSIQQHPWSILTTSGASLSTTSTLHLDDVERFVDNDQHDLIVFRGMILLGWLQVLKLLGTGTFGQVFLCRDLRHGRGEEPDCPSHSSSFRSASVNPPVGDRREYLSRTDWGGEDFQYYQCSSAYLPDGDVRRRPLTARLVAVKIVKAIPSYEMQSALEAEILVRAFDAAQGSSTANSRHDIGESSRLITLDDVPLSTTLRTDDGPVAAGGVTELLAHGVCYGHHCLVMTWYGENLYECIRHGQVDGHQQHSERGGRTPTCRGMSVDRIQVVGRQIIEALVILHEKLEICHGDIKPENILLEVAPAFQGDFYVPAEERILNEEERHLRQRLKEPTGALSGASTPPVTMDAASPLGPTTPVHGVSFSSPPLITSVDTRYSAGSSAISAALAAAATVHYSDSLCAVPPRRMVARVGDLGSAFSIHKPMFPYIQSRYYRAPEVILGAPYGAAIDLWSVGCVLAEMLLGLPLLPGHDNYRQLERIIDMFGPLPQSVLAAGKDTQKFYIWEPTQSPSTASPCRDGETGRAGDGEQAEPTLPTTGSAGTFSLKSPTEYYLSTGQACPSWKPYFQFRRLGELLQNGALSSEEREEATGSDGQPILSVLRRVGEKRKQLYQVLTHLLQPDPARRMSASQILKLSFFAEVGDC